jgi:hypothetical protein
MHVGARSKRSLIRVSNPDRNKERREEDILGGKPTSLGKLYGM